MPALSFSRACPASISARTLPNIATPIIRPWTPSTKSTKPSSIATPPFRLSSPSGSPTAPIASTRPGLPNARLASSSNSMTTSNSKCSVSGPSATSALSPIRSPSYCKRAARLLRLGRPRVLVRIALLQRCVAVPVVKRGDKFVRRRFLNHLLRHRPLSVVLKYPAIHQVGALPVAQPVIDGAPAGISRLAEHGPEAMCLRVPPECADREKFARIAVHAKILHQRKPARPVLDNASARIMPHLGPLGARLGRPAQVPSSHNHFPQPRYLRRRFFFRGIARVCRCARRMLRLRLLRRSKTEWQEQAEPRNMPEDLHGHSPRGVPCEPRRHNSCIFHSPGLSQNTLNDLRPRPRSQAVMLWTYFCRGRPGNPRPVTFL